MFKSLLIANRGEIACRIIRTAKQMGIHTVAVYSDADENALHVRQADEAFRLGPAPVGESYLRTGRILKIASDIGVEAIHPGYGFLSENADFAELCAESKITFVGPPADAIRAMGLKDQAKTIMADAGVPVVPGYHGEKQDDEFLKRKAYETGYPVMIKAVAGGGGKGLRLVNKAREFDAALAAARREAKSSFGNDRMLIEKFVAAPRHIEIQIFADDHGNVLHIFERDCSLQRRHQKVIEEAPAPGMSESLRQTMGEAACDAARAVGYRGAGTVEFIVSSKGGLKADGFYFMEMNTRLQVEHPVSELITGIDLVEWQLRVANGEPLPLEQHQIAINGHAVEARIYAEDPQAGFLPSIGKLVKVAFPAGIRVDSGVETGDEITPHYDPMIAKIIAAGPDRDTALDTLRDALGKTIIAGPKTNLAFLAALCDNQAFRQGAFDTGLIDENLDTLASSLPISSTVEAAGIVGLIEKRKSSISPAGDKYSPWAVNDGFSGGLNRVQSYRYILDGDPRDALVGFEPDGIFVLDSDGERIVAEQGVNIFHANHRLYLLHNGRQSVFEEFTAFGSDDEDEDGDGLVKVPMHGKIISLNVKTGDLVEKGDLLFAVEAMKMEHGVVAPRAGMVSACEIELGDQVQDGAVGLLIVDVDDAG